MKHTILLIVLFNFSGSLFGQTEKNDLGLSFSGIPIFNFAASNSLNGFSTKSSFYYFISNETAIEISHLFTITNDFIIGGQNSHSKTNTILPMIKSNFLNSEKVRIYGQAGIGLGALTYKADNNNEGFEHQFQSGGVAVYTAGLGADYNFNNRNSIEVSVPYVYSKNVTSSNYTIFNGMAPTIGVTFALNK